MLDRKLLLETLNPYELGSKEFKSNASMWAATLIRKFFISKPFSNTSISIIKIQLQKKLNILKFIESPEILYLDYGRNNNIYGSIQFKDENEIVRVLDFDISKNEK